MTELFILKREIPRQFLGQNIPQVIYYANAGDPNVWTKRDGEWVQDPNGALEMTMTELGTCLSKVTHGQRHTYSSVCKADAIATWQPDDWRNEPILTLDDFKKHRLSNGT